MPAPKRKPRSRAFSKRLNPNIIPTISTSLSMASSSIPNGSASAPDGELIDTKWLGIRPGGSARLKQIPMDGKKNLIINYWADTEGGSLAIHQDKLDGPVIASYTIKKTSGRQAVLLPLHAAPGKHDLYFVFHNPKIKPSQSVCGIEWFAFRDELPGQSA